MEQVRSITVQVVVDTNKATYGTGLVECDSLDEVQRVVAEFVESQQS